MPCKKAGIAKGPPGIYPTNFNSKNFRKKALRGPNTVLWSRKIFFRTTESLATESDEQPTKHCNWRNSVMTEAICAILKNPLCHELHVERWRKCFREQCFLGLTQVHEARIGADWQFFSASAVSALMLAISSRSEFSDKELRAFRIEFRSLLFWRFCFQFVGLLPILALR